jgi:hypothetical protein
MRFRAMRPQAISVEDGRRDDYRSRHPGAGQFAGGRRMGEAQRYYWWLICERGDTLWIENTEPVPPAGWDTLRCRYDGAPLRVFNPQAVK